MYKIYPFLISLTETSEQRKGRLPTLVTFGYFFGRISSLDESYN